MLKPGPELSTLSGASDNTLMAEITNRQYPALNELYSRYGDRLKSMIGTVVREEGEADDVLQEIMLQIWDEAGKYSPKAGKPLGWIITLTRRRAIDRVRRRQAYCRAKERYGEGLKHSLNGHNHKSAGDEISRQDLNSFLTRHLERLPKLQREALQLAFFKGMSHREIAATTQTPLGTVKTRLELGLRKLTQALKPLRHQI
jgi:RNA polymerase sigma-70 factor (ECF subfamily)